MVVVADFDHRPPAAIVRGDGLLEALLGGLTQLEVWLAGWVHVGPALGALLLVAGHLVRHVRVAQRGRFLQAKSIEPAQHVVSGDVAGCYAVGLRK